MRGLGFQRLIDFVANLGSLLIYSDRFVFVKGG